jgi:hypothetical protein
LNSSTTESVVNAVGVDSITHIEAAEVNGGTKKKGDSNLGVPKSTSATTVKKKDKSLG